MALGAIVMAAYYAVALFGVPLWLRGATGAPLEVVRKVQHVAFAFGTLLLLVLFGHWTEALAVLAGLALLAYPVLLAWEGRPSYRRWLTDRRPRGGELRRQLLQAVGTQALLIGVFWGLLGPEWRPAIAAAAMVWGFGDAAAALVGRYLGRRRWPLRAVEGAKTVEGTAAMVAAAAVAAFVTLAAFGGSPWWLSLVAAVCVAPVAGGTELFSRGGSDTVTVPLASALALMPWIALGHWLVG